MRSWMIAFSTGVIAAGFLPVLPSPLLINCAIFIALMLHCFPRSTVAGACLAGVCWLCSSAANQLALQWPTEDRQVEVWTKGRIASLPQASATGLRFVFEIEARCNEEIEKPCTSWSVPDFPARVQLSLYEDLVIKPGQQWQFLLHLHPPHGMVNPGTFDYELWLLQQGITATGYIRAHPQNRQLAGQSGQFHNRLRLALLEAIGATERLQHGDLIAALALGERSNISEQQWQGFTRTGTNHLMVISGLHVGLIATFLFMTATRLARCSATLVANFPARIFGAVTAVSGALVYGVLAGFSLPVQRALVMTLVMLSGILLRRETSSWNSYWLAMGLVLANEPLAPQSAGFWLSFGAVAVILSRLQPADETEDTAPMQKLLGLCRLQCRLWLGMLPVMLVWFQQVSWLAPLINLFAIPFIGLLVVPVALTGLALATLFPVAGSACFLIADFLLHLYLYLLDLVLRYVPDGLWNLPALTLPGRIMLTGASALLIFYRNRITVLVGLILADCAFMLQKPQPAAGELRVVVMDVGQGLAVLLSTEQHHLLYDADPRFSERFDAGSDVVVPVLRHFNVSSPDLDIISHADSDHAGGLQGVVENFGVDRYLLPEALATPGLQHDVCRAGEQWNWDGVQFTILHPDGNSYSRNNGSCVLLVSAGEYRVLLPGDIERKVEYDLLRKGILPTVNLLIAPHHGSRTSSSSALIKALNPDQVAISSGYLNRFGHPVAGVLRRYTSAGAQIDRTDQQGALIYSLDQTVGIGSVWTTRQHEKRFWR